MIIGGQGILEDSSITDYKNTRETHGESGEMEDAATGVDLETLTHAHVGAPCNWNCFFRIII